MMKSYQESNGTALSTDWNDVKKGKVETRPPDGQWSMSSFRWYLISGFSSLTGVTAKDWNADLKPQKKPEDKDKEFLSWAKKKRTAE